MRLSNRLSRRLVILTGSITALVFSGFVSPKSHAANVWDGGGANGNWSTPQNWDNDAVPAFPQPLTFQGATRLITNNDLTGLTVNGITFDATAAAFTLGGNAITLNGGIVSNTAAAQTINLPITLTSPQIVDVTFDGAMTIGPGTNGSGIIFGAGGLTKVGAGTLTLDAVNTYTGDTTLDGGTLAFGANNTVSNLIFGAAATVPFSTNSSTLNLTDASLTASSLDVRTSSTNSVTIGSGKTLTVNGPVNIGPNTAGLATSGIVTQLNVAGEGSFVVNTTGNFSVALPRTNADAGTDPFSTADLSGLSHFTFNAGTSTGEFRIGAGNARGTVILANTSNTITAAQVRVADSGIQPTGGSGNNNGGNSILTLGTGTNVINANNILVGAVKSPGFLNFQDPALGSVTIAGQAGGTSTANITVGSASSATGSNTISQFELASHVANVQAGTVIIGRLAGGTGGTGGGNMTFDTGTFTVSSFQLAVNSSGTAANGAVGTFVLGGDFPNNTATGVLNVTNQFFLANRTTTNATTPARGTFIINGGTANINTDIIDASTTGDASTRTTALTLAGGTLNMMGHVIGSATAPITTITITGGTLKNVQEINGGAGLTFSGSEADTLILDGINSYTGGTTIAAGTLQVGTGGLTGNLGGGPVTNDGTLVFNSSGTQTVSDPISGIGSLRQIGPGTTVLGAANTYAGSTTIGAGVISITGSITGTIAVNAGGTLAGSGDGVTTGKTGSVIMAAGSALSPGATAAAGDVGTLTLSELTVNGGDLRFDLGATSDRINVTGTANFAGASTLTPNAASPAGSYTVLTAGTLTLGTPPTVNAPTGTRKTFTADFATPNTIKLVITGSSKTLTWTGATNGVWDVGSAGTLNWSDGAAAERFFNADTVTFGNGPANRNITINGTVIPTAVTVDNSISNGYVFSGSGSVGGGATLTKTGAGGLTLNNANTYTGGTTLNAGTLNINNPAALGTGAFTITGGVIDNTSGAPITLTTNNRQNWSGDIVFWGTNNLNLGTGAVALNANRTVTVNAGTLTVAGIISGDFELTKAGTGALTLAGANAHTGGTTLTAGTLNLNHAAALGTGALNITGGAIDNTSGAPITLTGSNPIDLNANLVFAGTNDLNLGNGAMLLLADRTLTVNASTLTVGGVISGDFGLTKAGAALLALSGANTYTGPTVISAGTVRVTNAASSVSSLGSLFGGEVTIASGAALDLSGNPTAQALNFGGKVFNIAGTGVGGTGAIVNHGVSQFNALQQVRLTADATVGGTQRFDIRGFGSMLDLAGFTLTKNGTNQFSLVNTTVTDGDIVVNQGVFAIEAGTSISDNGTGKTITYNAGTTAQFFSNTGSPSAVTRPMVFNGSGIQIGSASNNNNSIIGSNITLNGDVTVTNLNNANNTSLLTLTGNITEIGGARSITKNGPTTLILTGNNSYTGGTLINTGRVQVGDGGLSGSLGTGPVVDNALLAFNRSDDFTVANAISGTGSVQKDGAGTLTLSGNSSYTGATTIDNGTLIVSGSLSGTSSIAATFGTLQFGGSNRIADGAGVTLANSTLNTAGFSETLGALTLSGTAQLDLGTGSSILRFADSSSNALAWTGNLSITNWNGSPSGGGTDQIFFGNSSAGLTTDQLSLITFIDPFGPGTGIVDARMLPTGELVAIPEPNALLALIAGAGVLGFRTRRNRAPRNKAA